MTARLLAAALAFVITGAPVAMTICEAACAARSAGATHGEHHSCHEPAPTNQASIAGLPHGCGHSDGGDQLGADSGIKVFAPPMVFVGSIAFIPPAFAAAGQIGDGEATHSPPRRLARSTQLRI